MEELDEDYGNDDMDNKADSNMDMDNMDMNNMNMNTHANMDSDVLRIGSPPAPPSKQSVAWRCCVAFEFVSWSSPSGIGVRYPKSNVKRLPLKARTSIVNADQWIRLGFWSYVVVAIALGASDGYWLGSHGTRPFVNIGCLTMPGQICFHYCFILTGYALKGIRSPHVPMLKLVCCCTCFNVIVTVVACVTMFYRGNWWYGIEFGVVGVVLGYQTWDCWKASNLMTSQTQMFPKSGVSHNWM